LTENRDYFLRFSQSTPLYFHLLLPFLSKCEKHLKNIEKQDEKILFICADRRPLKADACHIFYKALCSQTVPLPAPLI